MNIHSSSKNIYIYIMNNAFMNPHFKKNPETHKRNVLFGTGLVLIAAFLLIIL